MLIFFLLLRALSSDGAFHLDPQWQRLLYLDLETGPYLLSPERSAEAEWKKTLELFRDPQKKGNDHPQCLYPARRLVLERLLGSSAPARVVCPDFDEWMAKISPQGVSLVFAGNYPDNPGSLFGHTFLRIHTTTGASHAVLDQAINFSAEVSDDIGFVYAVKGLVGSYYGGYTLTPYYVKLNEYNEAEGRDVWEYRTDFTPRETEFLLAHIWELKQRAEFRYFFLSQNCSYFIIRLFDILRPQQRLAQELPWYVIPLETIKVFSRRGLATAVTYRPSVRLMARRYTAKLDSRQRRELEALLDADEEVVSQDPQVLHAAAWQISALHSRSDGVLAASLKQKEAVILTKMSRLEVDDRLELQHAAPDQGHAIGQLAFGVLSQQKPGLLLEYRLGVHELTDSPLGYLPLSELAILKTRLAVEERKVSLNQVDFLSMMVLRPRSIEEREWSWSTRANYEHRATLFAAQERQVHLNFLAGTAHQLGDHVATFLAGPFALAQGLRDLGYGLALEPGLISRWHRLMLVNRVQVLQRLDQLRAYSHQLVPQSIVTFRHSTESETQLEASYPLRLGNFFPSAGQVALKFDHHF